MRLKKVMALSLAISMAVTTPVWADTETTLARQGTVSSALKRGDVNNDGIVDASDALKALQAISGTVAKQDAHVVNGDLNEDGTLSVRDALMILQDIAGLADYQLGYEQYLDDVEYYIPEGFEEAEDGIGFLGADGYGKYTTGGRGGQVVEVTNLNDSGEGSLRAAIEMKGPRTIVFKVSGTIYLNSNLTIKNGDVTIAGQTAPGDGICLANYGLHISDTSNVIVRYLRIRSGDQMGKQNDSVDVKGSKDVIVDHCSVTWGTDETLSVSPSGDGNSFDAVSDRVSVQWNIVAQSITSSVNVGKSRHGMGSLIRVAQGSKVTFHHNMYVTHSSRMPMIGTYMSSDLDSSEKHVEFINNLVYNWSGQSSGKSSDADENGTLLYLTTYNYINNYFKSGPISTGKYMFSEASIGNHMYASGNMMDGELPDDQISLIRFEDDVLATDKNPYYVKSGLVLDQTKYLLDAPYENSMMTQVQSAQKAAEEVELYAGASLFRDTVDAAIVKTYQDGTGKTIDYIYESPGWTGTIPSSNSNPVYAASVDGQYPGLASYPSYVDTDKDGMSDAWEDFAGLDKNDPDDGKAAYKDTSFTNLEVFLQFLIENPEAAIGR